MNGYIQSVWIYPYLIRISAYLWIGSGFPTGSSMLVPNSCIKNEERRIMAEYIYSADFLSFLL